MTAVAQQPTPAAQVKGLRAASRILVLAGLLVGLGMPALFFSLKIRVAMTPSGIDLIWLVFLALMITDFVLAWWFRRRATAIERAIPPA